MTGALRRPFTPYAQPHRRQLLMHRTDLTLFTAAAIAATTGATAVASSNDVGLSRAQRAQVRGAPVTRLDLTPSSPDLARCMPNDHRPLDDRRHRLRHPA